MDPGWWCRSLIAPSKFLAGVWSRPRGGKLTYAEPPVAPLLDPELYSISPHLLSSWVQMAAGVCRVALLPCTASIFLLVDNWKITKHKYTHTSQYTPSDSFKNDCLSLKKNYTLSEKNLFQIILTFHIWPFDFFIASNFLLSICALVFKTLNQRHTKTHGTFSSVLKNDSCHLQWNVRCISLDANHVATVRQADDTKLCSTIRDWHRWPFTAFVYWGVVVTVRHQLSVFSHWLWKQHTTDGLTVEVQVGFEDLDFNWLYSICQFVRFLKPLTDDVLLYFLCIRKTTHLFFTYVPGRSWLKLNNVWKTPIAGVTNCVQYIYVKRWSFQ